MLPAPKLPFLLADQLLSGEIGHHLGYNLALADAAFAAGWEPVLVTAKSFNPALAGGVPVIRLFPRDLRADPPAWIGKNYRLLKVLEWWSSIQFERALSRIPDSGPQLIFAQMIAPRHFQAWLRWLANASREVHVVLHLGYRPGRFDSDVVRAAIAGLPPSARKRLALVSDSEKMAPKLGEVLRSEVAYLPHVISWKSLPEPRQQPPEGPLVVLSAGNARREKGFSEVLKTAELLAGEAASGLRFLVQNNQPDAFSAEILRQTRESIPGVEFLGAAPDEAEYLARLQSASLVFLPYHLDCYDDRTSGVFCEARVLGIPVVATAGSWAGDRVAAEGGGWLVPEKNPRAMADVLLQAKNDIGSKTQEAAKLASSARREFDRRAFLEKLVRLTNR